MNQKKQIIISSLDNLSSACENLKNNEIFLKKYNSWIKIFISTISNEGTIFICGNGGSFAHSQHLTTELVVRFNINREPIRAICLGASQSNLTAIGNDFSFDQIFIRELSALYKPNDTVFILSTSGNSQNVIKVAEYVRSMGGNALSLIGKDGGLHPVQKAFIEEIGPQCGFCTPGQVVSAVTLLENNPKPTVDQVRHALSGNLCRCGAYDHYLKGVMKAAGRA